MRYVRFLLLLGLVVVVALALGSTTPPELATATGGNSITSPDTAEWVGEYTSLALDASGFPVISYLGYGQYPATSGLKVLHCDDPNCAGNESGNVKLLDTGFQIGNCTFVPGYYTSLALDASGNPVVSYRRPNCGTYVGALKVLHCANASCTGYSITEPDPVADGGVTSSLALDASGNPVISHFDGDNTHLDLRLVHCNDPVCAGGGDSVTAPDTAGYVGSCSSLALDVSGNPVVSYQHGDGYLKLLHCDDPNCGGDESGNIDVPDASGYTLYTSLELDGSDNPVVSYYDRTNRDLKVLHCNDPNCDPTVNGPESITSPDTAGEVGSYTSLELDGSGNPVVSYYDAANGALKVMHCNDPNCAGGDETVASPDTEGDVGQWTSLGLDASGFPVVSYYDATNHDLKVLHCSDAFCGADRDADGVPDASDNCPDTANPGQENNVHPATPEGDHCEDPDGDGYVDAVDGCPDTHTVWATPIGDGDCDGWSSADEGVIGTDAADACPDNGTDDCWPPDFDMNTVVNISDVFKVLPPYFGLTDSSPGWDPRRDLVPDGVINIADVFKVLPPYFGYVCTP